MLPSSGRTRRTTRTELPELRNEMDRLLSDFFGGRGNGSSVGNFAPPTDLYETEDAYVLESELPGFHRDDVRVSLENGTLSISGRREASDEVSYRRRERATGRFERRFRLPRSVKPDEITARMEHGILRVEVPKAEEARSKTIEVEVG